MSVFFSDDLDRAFDVDRALDLVRALDRDVDLVCCKVLELDRDRGIELVRSLELVCDRVRVRDRSLELDPTFEDIQIRIAQLKRLVDGVNVDERPQVSPRRVALTARWVTVIAARALPTEARARYAEEWGSELWELAVQAGEPRRRQLAHALCTLSCVWWTRRAVLTEQRHLAGGG
jgi:hypothetical protein